MFGLGLTEIVIFLVIAFIVFGIPIAIVVLLVFLLRKPQSSINDSSQLSQLRNENERLRRELSATKTDNP
jgi:hypothetical protein